MTAPPTRPPAFVIVGVDPGIHVGFARLWADDHFEACELTRIEAEDALLTTFYGKHPPGIIAMERFTIVGGRARTSQPDALELIGAARFIARHHEPTAFRVQGSADADPFAARDVLTRLGWWIIGAPDHVRRACGQVALALSLTDPARYVRLLGPEPLT